MSRENEKLKTPDYVFDIRNGKYNTEPAITLLLEKCNVKKVPPINVWEIARQLNFKVFEADFKDPSLSGMMVDSRNKVAIFDCKRAIILNKNENSGVQAFTIAHEIAHFLLHCNESKEFFEAYHITRNKEREEMTSEERIKQVVEDEADSFAASLLMPTSLFQEYYYRLKNGKSIENLTSELSKIFMVEEEAIERRYKEVGIV